MGTGQSGKVGVSFLMLWWSGNHWTLPSVLIQCINLHVQPRTPICVFAAKEDVYVSATLIRGDLINAVRTFRVCVHVQHMILSCAFMHVFSVCALDLKLSRACRGKQTFQFTVSDHFADHEIRSAVKNIFR